MQRGLALKREVLLQLLRVSDHFALVLLLTARRGSAESVLRGRGLVHGPSVDGQCLGVGLLRVHVLHLLRHGARHVRVDEAVHARVRAFEGSHGDCALLKGEAIEHHELERALRVECGLRGLRVESLGRFEVYGLTAPRLEGGV